MLKTNISKARKWQSEAGLVGAILALALSTPAQAFSCRVTDFTDQPLSSLHEVERLSFVTEMTNTEYDRLKAERQGAPNYYPLIAESKNIRDARQSAMAKLNALNIKNIDGYRKTWAIDFLSDEQQRKFLDCMSQREPGLMVAGRSVSPSQFNLTFTHMTPVGIRKIETELVATNNIANASALEKYLRDIGPQDNYPARTFELEIADPKKKAMVIIQAGWETPRSLFIPVYPTGDFLKNRTEAVASSGRH